MKSEHFQESVTFTDSGSIVLFLCLTKKEAARAATERLILFHDFVPIVFLHLYFLHLCKRFFFFVGKKEPAIAAGDRMSHACFVRVAEAREARLGHSDETLSVLNVPSGAMLVA